jgi:ribose transport system permease protein
MSSDTKSRAVGFKLTRLGLSQFRELSLLLVLAALILFLSLGSPYFAKWANIKVALGSMSIDGMAVIGMTIILISGGIDLSVGSVMCLCMTIIAKFLLAGINPWLAAFFAMLICTAIGALIGLIVTYIKLNHFIVTLCFMGICRGLVYIVSNGGAISLMRQLEKAPAFRYLGQGQIGGVVPMTVVIFLVIAVIAEIVLRKSLLMRMVFYVGSNEKAAVYSGINVKRVKVLTCATCSAFAAVAGVLYVNKFQGVPITSGTGLEMTAIAAAVIGGVSLNGGKGSLLGAVFGLTLMVLVQNGLTLFSVPAYWQDFIRYLIVLFSIVLDALRQNSFVKRTE